MELTDVIQYAHKVKKIKITNENKHSKFSFVIIKITLPTRDDENVRFSLEPNKSFLEHQTNGDDYYCRVPNKLNDISYIYAHFLPSDLYEYDNEITDFVSFYDFNDLTESEITLKNKYENSIDEEGRLIVQSTDIQSIDGYHNPNYKQYTDIDNIKNKTKQGRFPLSSKYRSNQDWEVPNLSDPYPKWKNNTNAPIWEAKIPFENMEGPINVFINYEYLPTSREYHQHYYGFEASQTENRTINVFEGTNINTIDKKFGSENNYRLINYGNPYSDKHSFYLPHENIIPIDLNEEGITIKYNSNREPTCKWKKNWCYDYYIFTPLQTTNNDEKYCYKHITLEEGKYYSLQYYIYIPSYVDIEDNKGYISVIGKNNIEYKIDDIFIRKDKKLRDQWIYHEVPFLADTTNIIKFVGPQALTNDNSIFFIKLELHEMVEYSPTLQYSETGLRLVEQDKTTFKSIAEHTSSNNTSTQITPDNVLYSDDDDFTLPIPYSNIVINTNNEKYVYYDPKTTNLYCIHPIYENDETHIMRYDSITTNLYGIKNDNDVGFRFQTEDNNNEWTKSILFGRYNEKIVGVYGPDNIFVFNFTDTNGNVIENGTVTVGIFMTNSDLTNDLNNPPIKITQSPIQVNGIMYFNADLTNLAKNTTDPDNLYYIRLEYENPCQIPNKIVYKPLYVYEENVSIECVQINNSSTNKSQQSIIDYGYYIDDINQIPLKISACIKDQYGTLKQQGYCELSVNDKLHQSTINDNGYVDFYLNLEDLEYGHQTIKIEYYRKYYKSLGFIYFDLELKEIVNRKPCVEVNVKVLNNGQTYNVGNNYTAKIDDCVLSTITTGDHSKFRIEVYCDDKLIEKRNIYNKTNNTIDFINTKYGDWSTHTFTIKTGNMQDANGNDIEDLYRDYVRTFTISYTS